MGALSGVRVLAIAAGSRHSLALADGGDVYSFGDGAGGRLGLADGERMHWVPTRIAGVGAGVAAIAAGECHSLCVLRDGRVLSWGAGGALGLPEQLLHERDDNPLPASWGSAGNHEWAPGDELRRARQAHRPTLVHRLNVHG